MKKHFFTKLIVLVFGLGVQSAQASLLAVDLVPGGAIDSTLETSPGSTFNVNVVINDIVDLAGFDFTLDFDNTVLAVNSVTSGNFFGVNTESLANTTDFNFINFAEASNLFLVGGMDVDSSTNAVLATIQFQVLTGGFSSLNLGNLAETFLSDSPGDPIAFTQQGADVTAVPLPPSVLLFGSTLLGLIGFRKKSQANPKCNC